MLDSEPYKNKKMKREGQLIDLISQSNEIRQLNQELFQDYEFQSLLYFCNFHKHYQFSEIIADLGNINPIKEQYQYFSEVHYKQSSRKCSIDQQLYDKLKQLLSQNRITPKVLPLIRVKGNEIILRRRQTLIFDEIQKVFDNDEYLIPHLDIIEQDFEKKEYSQDVLILKALEVLKLHAQKYVNSFYLSYQDIQLIRDTNQQMKKVSFEGHKTNQTIVKYYDFFMTLLNSQGTGFDNEDIFRATGSLKQLILKKIGKIFLLELAKKNIGLPRILQQVYILQTTKQNIFGEFGAIDVKFSQDFLEYLNSFYEVYNVKQELQFSDFSKLLTWKNLKNYYWAIIVGKFGEYEKYTEVDAISLQIQELNQRTNLYFEDLKKQLKNTLIIRMLQSIEQRINYIRSKDEHNEINEVNNNVLKLGVELIRLRNKIIKIDHKDDQPTKLNKNKQTQKLMSKQRELDNLNLEYSTLTEMLTCQRKKISYLMKYFVSNLIQSKLPYPYIISCVRCNHYTIRVEISFTVLDFLVKQDIFIKFILEEYQVDISQGKTQERIEKMIAINYSKLVKENFERLSWTKILAIQADLIYDNKERISWDLEKFLKVKTFDEVVDKISESGDTCQKRRELFHKIKKIRDYLFHKR